MEPCLCRTIGRQLFHRRIELQVNDVGLGVFVKPMFAVGSAYARLSPASVKTLHGFKVFPVNVGLAELDLFARTHGNIDVARVDR